ncbi:hypothetical protein SAMN05660865_00537 [Caloramator fervidus]|uniref:Coat F domain-containing protein n=1 Tax=Caloramator fervidus TaxID=29344 RepID=A0A1H5T269_9CLOT|nr:hypothetical protein [Caloramator fervidus]SEF56886.1 hypothetical protein SAMN05660865_00537 [Caloramator fervidus]
MSQLNQLELQNLRHLINLYDIEAQKFDSYAQMATDPQIKQMFIQAAQTARNTKQKLLSFLQ